MQRPTTFGACSALPSIERCVCVCAACPPYPPGAACPPGCSTEATAGTRSQPYSSCCEFKTGMPRVLAGVLAGVEVF